MKKQIALIIISLLAVLPVNAHKTQTHNVCNPYAENCPVIQDSLLPKPCCGLQISCPQIPQLPQLPEIPEIPEIPDIEQDEGVIATPSQQELAQILDLVNKQRQKSGILPLTYDKHLEKCADVRSREIKTLFSHTRPNGKRCFSVLDEYGYDYGYAGENLAYGQKTPAEVFSAWMGSQGHRENILNPNYTKIGMSCYGSTTLYWSQFFAG